MENERKRIFLTGASGYIGGRLRRLLEEDSRELVCLTRNPDYLAPRVRPATRIVAGDVLDRESLEPAMRGCRIAYYLVHSMEGKQARFEEKDRQAALNFVWAAKRAGIEKIIYLGGLGHGRDLSAHLRSRQEVGRILRSSEVPTIEFRASIIIGSGSLSFEMIRALVNKLPVMVTPKWVRVLTQPIAVEDVLRYLKEAIRFDPPSGGATFEIGAYDRVSYGDLMREYARQRGLKRFILPVPFLSPRLSSLWLGLVTPIYARTGRSLIEGVRNETVVHDTRAREVFPFKPLSTREAIERAIANEDRTFAETRWSDALSSSGFRPVYGGVRFGNRLVDSRSLQVSCEPARAFRPIRLIGGDRGWYYADFLWSLRGFLDLVFGGVGVRRGRRHPEEVLPGDTIDFWRVEAIEPDRLLRLKAEMKVPGRAWLQFEVTPERGGSTIRQTAIFDPVGLPGVLYWYAVYPIHRMVFEGMLRGLASAAEDSAGSNEGAGQPDEATL